MLTPIDDANVGRALDLLVEGFPVRSRAFWETALARIHELGGNKAAGVPIGLLLEDKGKDIGVTLTPASTRPRDGGGPPVVIINFSSSYVKPEHALRTSVLFRGVTRMKADVILDLTAMPRLHKTLMAIGFKPLTHGVTVNLLPLTLVTAPHGAKVKPLRDAARETLTPEIRDLLLAHERYNCIAALLKAPSGDLPLLFKIKTAQAGLKAAILMYCPDTARLHAHLGSVAGFLLQRGVSMLRLDLPVNGTAPGIERPGRDVKFAIGTPAPGAIDYAGTELALFDL